MIRTGTVAAILLGQIAGEHVLSQAELLFMATTCCDLKHKNQSSNPERVDQALRITLLDSTHDLLLLASS